MKRPEPADELFQPRKIHTRNPLLMSTPRPPDAEESWTETAIKLMEERYLILGESPKEMLWRVATEAACGGKEWDDTSTMCDFAHEVYQAMVNREFLPNSPTLMNAGAMNGLQLAACFVLPIPDSMEGIFNALRNSALIHKSGGGTGFSFSRLRQEGAKIYSTNGSSSGPVSFLSVFNAATEVVKQGGTRRGANMAVLRVTHPDIIKFIRCKIDGGITNFNISVGVTNAFMDAVAGDRDYVLLEPHSARVHSRISARSVWNHIVQAAWLTGDPGLFFVDQCNAGRANAVPSLGGIEATNPCGEQPLYPNEACNLGSINLAALYNGEFDYDRLVRLVRMGIKFLDNIIEVSPYPLREIVETVWHNRRVGLGVMGWADLLLKAGIRYGSKESTKLAENIMLWFRKAAVMETEKLAKIRGAFPNFPRSIYRNDLPRRNCGLTTVAPTGSISLIAGCSSGIEPIYSPTYTHVVGERSLAVASDAWSDALEKTPDACVTAHGIIPEEHINMQAAFQKFVDSGVSKTVNLPQTATQQDIGEAYRYAYTKGCIGVTVFRDGCKGHQVLNACEECKI